MKRRIVWYSAASHLALSAVTIFVTKISMGGFNDEDHLVLLGSTVLSCNYCYIVSANETFLVVFVENFLRTSWRLLKNRKWKDKSAQNSLLRRKAHRTQHPTKQRLTVRIGESVWVPPDDILASGWEHAFSVLVPQHVKPPNLQLLSAQKSNMSLSSSTTSIHLARVFARMTTTIYLLTTAALFGSAVRTSSEPRAPPGLSLPDHLPPSPVPEPESEPWFVKNSAACLGTGGDPSCGEDGHGSTEVHPPSSAPPTAFVGRPRRGLPLSVFSGRTAHGLPEERQQRTRKTTTEQPDDLEIWAALESVLVTNTVEPLEPAEIAELDFLRQKQWVLATVFFRRIATAGADFCPMDLVSLSQWAVTLFRSIQWQDSDVDMIRAVDHNHAPRVSLATPTLQDVLHRVDAINYDTSGGNKSAVVLPTASSSSKRYPSYQLLMKMPVFAQIRLNVRPPPPPSRTPYHPPTLPPVSLPPLLTSLYTKS